VESNLAERSEAKREKPRGGAGLSEAILFNPAKIKNKKGGNMLIIIRKHPGRYDRDGGQYGYWECIQRSQYGYQRTFHTSSDIERTPSPEIWGEDEVDELLAQIGIGASKEEFLVAVNSNREFVVDVTGHKPSNCPAFGGCIICYPPGCDQQCKSCGAR